MKREQFRDVATRALVRLTVAFACLLVAFGANADDCLTLYAKSGAVPGTRSCRLDVVSNTPSGMGNYACINDIALIDQWCTVPDAEKPEKSCPVADPVYPGSGAVTLTEGDFVSGDDIPMRFTRTYRSKPLAKNVSAMGPAWFHNWQRQLGLANANSGSSSSVLAYRENGEPVTFGWVGGQWRTAGFTGLALAQNGANWVVTDLNTDSTESYSARGVLLSESTKTGVTRTLTYDSAGLLTSITQHAAGTSANRDITLRLDYDDRRRISRLNDPMSGITQYAYDANDNLAAVTWPDGYVHRYVYDDVRFRNALTGDIDEAGMRIGTWTYDAMGRAMAVSHPDATRNVQFAYSAGSTVITDSRRATTLKMSSIAGMLRPTGTQSTAGRTASTWDISGNLLKDEDATGGTSDYSYDSTGRPVKAIIKKPLETAVTTFRYADAISLHPAMIASPGLIQSFVYDVQGNAIGVSETPTLDATGASGFDAMKADGVTRAWGIAYDAANRVKLVQLYEQGKLSGQWKVTRDDTGNVFAIIVPSDSPEATEMIARDAAHRVLYGYNPIADFQLHYDKRGRIDLFYLQEYASPANGGVRRVLKVVFRYSPDSQITLRTGTVAKNGSMLNLNDGSDVSIGDEEIGQWIDNYNYGDSPIGPPANFKGARSLLQTIPGVGSGVVCSDCHFEAGLIDGALRGIAIAWRLARNPVVQFGIGQGRQKVADAIQRLKEMCKPAAEIEVEGIPPGRITSDYRASTAGRSVWNIRTDVGKAEFETNLRNDGWAQTLSKDGKSDIFTKGDRKYAVREQSNEGSITADYSVDGGKAILKIRLSGK